MDIFTTTGFDKVFSIKKGMRRISVRASDLIGQGANGEVYRLKDETIVKVFYPGADLKSVEKEDRISHIVFESGIPVVIPYDTVKVDNDRYGIVYETLGAKTLSETIEAAPEDFDKWMKKYVGLYRVVHTTDGSKTGLPLTKDVYRTHLSDSADWYSK